MIKGIENLTKTQRETLLTCNNLQRDCIENPARKKDFELIEAWVDENGIVCGKIKNGNWYHYTENMTWY